MTSPLRAKHGMVTEGGPPRITPRFFNAAFPQMIARGARAGSAIRIAGVSEDGPVELTVPDHALSVRLRFGDEVHEARPALDQIGVEVDLRRVFIAYRHPFRYVVRELQERACELFEQGFSS